MSLAGKIHAVFCVIAISTVAGLLVLIDAQDSALVESVQSGKSSLYCQMHDGWRQIPADKIKAFDGARWVFTNGSASSCKVLEVGK